MLIFLCKLWPYLAGGLIGWLLCGWFARRLKYAHPPVEKIIENTITVDKIIDNPEHLSLISDLQADNAQISDLKTRIANFENAKLEVVEKIVDNPQHISKIDSLEKQIAAMSRGPDVDVGKAKAAGFRYKDQGNSAHADFTVVEGVGPKIDELIHGAGIHTYRELAMTDPEDIQKVLDAAGSNFKLAKPGTWPAQSGLAANNQWEALKAWQDILDGGEK